MRGVEGWAESERTREAGHVDAVGTADHGDHAVAGGGSGEKGEEEDVRGMHRGGCKRVLRELKMKNG